MVTLGQDLGRSIDGHGHSATHDIQRGGPWDNSGNVGNGQIDVSEAFDGNLPEGEPERSFADSGHETTLAGNSDTVGSDDSETVQEYG